MSPMWRDPTEDSRQFSSCSAESRASLQDCTTSDASSCSSVSTAGVPPSVLLSLAPARNDLHGRTGSITR